MNARLDAWRLLTNLPLVVGFASVVALLVIGVFGYELAPYEPNAQRSLILVQLPDGREAFHFPPTAPGKDHLLGTDPLGRDQWSRILGGARLTLAVVLTAAVARLVLGFTLGVAAGWYGGAAGRGIRILAAGVAAIPQLLLAILLVLATRAFGVTGFVLSLAAVGWPELVEYTSAEARRAKAAPFMEAARSVGAPGRSLIGRHLIATLSPQLLTLAALETGSVLLLLAELGLIGLFLAGTTYYVEEQTGLPILPIRDRAPEWGQMLGGIQFYAIQEQLVVLIPALFVVLVVVAFGLLADGIRAAADPYSPRRVLPRTFGVLGRALAIILLVSAVGFGAANVPSAVMSIEEGRAIAAVTAERTWPGSVFVGGVVRFSSTATGMERPDRITYYYRRADRSEVLRISFKEGAREAIEVRPYETEDEIDFASMRGLPAGLAAMDVPLRESERSFGAHFRSVTPNYVVRVIVTWPQSQELPRYEVAYGTVNRGQLTMRSLCCWHATSAAHFEPPVAPPLEVSLLYPVPADCAATPLVQERYRNNVSWWTQPPGLSVGLASRAFYAGDNVLQHLEPPGRLRLVSARHATDPSAQATLDPTQPASGGEFGVAVLRLATSGCWTLTLRVEDGPGTDVVAYAYPWRCRGELAPSVAPPDGVADEDCHPR